MSKRRGDVWKLKPIAFAGEGDPGRIDALRGAQDRISGLEREIYGSDQTEQMEDQLKRAREALTHIVHSLPS